MKKFILIRAKNLYNSPLMGIFLKTINLEDIDIHYTDKNTCYLLVDSDYVLTIENIASTISSDLGVKMSIIVAHDINEVANKTLTFAYENGIPFAYLPSVVLQMLLLNKLDIKKAVINEFEDVPYELILTAKAYISNGLNAKNAANSLYVHRNTFNYRLTKFIKSSKLDIRDFWNALYFQLYLELTRN
ncbi:MAG: helix-turn-helix domain-containing protein [Bacilli bacterium]|jgi:hypothetical protein